MRSPLIIGTRGSDLALWQARYVQSLLKEIGLDAELKIIKTQGDKIQDLSFDKMEGKGFFTKEIEEALLSGDTDIAVHSHKDLPTDLAPGLIIAAVSSREDPADVLLIRKECTDFKQKFNLKRSAILGTSSARRKAQIKAFRSDLNLKDLRGNVPTRIGKLKSKDYDAILVAAAGIERLEINLDQFHVERLDPKEFIPAPAQGVLAIQIRNTDADLQKQLLKLHNTEVGKNIAIEREVLHLFHGGCQMPVGVYAEYDEDKEVYEVRASRATAWDQLPVSVYIESKDASIIPARIIEKINSVKPTSVFISRNIENDSYFNNVLSGNGFKVVGLSLIEMLEVPYGNLPDFNWVFFSSKHAVKYFFNQKPNLENIKFACIGKSTSEMLRRFGQRAEFIGASTDTKMTGKQFAAKVGRDKVLFPQAKGSLKTIQHQLVHRDQAIDLVVYESVKRNSGLCPDAEILVFTSPSNVDAWFENWKINSENKIIAMGDATANALRQHRVKMLSRTDAFDEAGLARAVFNASSR